MLLMVITGFAGYRGAARLLEANGWVRHTFTVIGAAENIRADLFEFETAGRGYVVTGDENFLQPTKEIVSRITQNRLFLRTLTADNPVQQHRLDTLDPMIGQGLADLTTLTNVRAAKGLAAAQIVLRQGSSRER